MVASGRLVARPLMPRGLHRRWCAVMPKDLAKTDRVRAFIDLPIENAPVETRRSSPFQARGRTRSQV
jgi:hypothetical protein